MGILQKISFIILLPLFIQSCFFDNSLYEVERDKKIILDSFEKIREKHTLNPDEDLINTIEYEAIDYKTSSIHNETSLLAKQYIDSIQKMQSLVMNNRYGKLFEYAEKNKWNDISKDELIKIEKSFMVPSDGFSSSNTYRHPSSPKYVNYNGFFLFYVKSENDTPELFLSLQYRGNDWLFIKSASVSADGTVYDLPHSNWEMDNQDYIFEWSTDEFYKFNILIQILESNESKIKFNGQQYYDINTINQSQKNAIKDLLKVYYGLYLKDNVKFD